MVFMKRCLFLLLCVVVAYAQAESFNPKGCRTVSLQNGALTLTKIRPARIFMHNTTGAKLWVTHPDTDINNKVNWLSQIQAGHWSILALSRPSFALICIESQPGHEQQVPCESVLDFCALSKDTHNEVDKKTMWLAEDITKTLLKDYL